MRTIAPLLALLACGPRNSVDPVAGRLWPMETSFLTVDPDTFDGDDLLTITLSSLPDSCDRDRLFRDAAADAEGPAALADAWASAYPEPFFEVDVVARVQGGTWPPKGALWSGLPWDAFPEQNNVVFAVLTEHVAVRDEAYWAGDYEDEDDYEHVFYTDGGLAKWGKATPGLRVTGRMNADVVDGSGNYAGATEIRFDATVCGP